MCVMKCSKMNDGFGLKTPRVAAGHSRDNTCVACVPVSSPVTSTPLAVVAPYPVQVVDFSGLSPGLYTACLFAGTTLLARVPLSLLSAEILASRLRPLCRRCMCLGEKRRMRLAQKLPALCRVLSLYRGRPPLWANRVPHSPPLICRRSVVLTGPTLECPGGGWVGVPRELIERCFFE